MTQSNKKIELFQNLKSSISKESLIFSTTLKINMQIGNTDYHYKQMNSLKIIISSLLILSAVTLRLSAHQQIKGLGGSTKVGAYSDLDVDHLPNDAREIDVFLRGKHNNFENGLLVNASRQVVAGMNYRMIYISSDGSKQWDIVVFKTLKGDLYENGYTMTQTLQNGQKVKAIADPSSAFIPPQDIVPQVQAITSVTSEEVEQKYRQVDRTTIPNSIAPKILGQQ